MAEHWEIALGDEKDYGHNWVDWLDGDTIATSTWTVDAGLEQINATLVGTIAVVWLKPAGTAVVGETYAATNRITTAGGRSESHPLWFTVKE